MLAQLPQSYHHQNVHRQRHRERNQQRLAGDSDDGVDVRLKAAHLRRVGVQRAEQARRLQQQHGIGLVIIDYMQLMTGSAKAESRQQEISQISRALKGMAKDLDVPVLALSQLSRAVESRRDHKPMLSDLRESGAIEQDADVVLFIFREEVYKPEDETVRTMATVIIGKQRNGPTGEFDLHFHKEFTRFNDLAR